MSKQSLLTLANFNLFRNTNQEIDFSIAKDHRVQAQYSAYDKQKGFDVRGIRAKSSSGVAYKAASEGPKAPVDAFDLENDPPLTTKGGAPAFDDMDDDIPF